MVCHNSGAIRNHFFNVHCFDEIFLALILLSCFERARSSYNERARVQVHTSALKGTKAGLNVNKDGQSCQNCAKLHSTQWKFFVTQILREIEVVLKSAIF